MKRFFALVALVLGLASCQTEPEGLDVQMGGAVDATITVNIPDSETRAGGTNSAGSIFDNGILGTEDDAKTMRYILQIYDANGNPSKDRRVTHSDGRTVNFDVRLVPDRHYSFVVWADYVTSENTDNHYDTRDLKNITLKADTWLAMDETRDAFTGVFNTKVDGNGGTYNGAKTIELKLKRPFAKLRVVTTDMKQLNYLDIKPTRATVEYTVDHYNAFNAFAGKVIGDSKNRDIKHENFEIKAYGDNVDDKSMVLFTDYFFAADEEEEAVNFTLAVYDQNGVIIGKTNNFNTDIAVKRNHLTTIEGNILTDGNKVNVTVEDTFGENKNQHIDYKTISSVAEFYAALNTEGQFIVISDLTIAEAGTTINNGQVGTLSTRTGGATTEGKVTTINLNGKTITVTNKTTEPFATVAAGNTLVITNTVDGGKIELTEGSKGAFIENNGTVVIENGNIKSESTNDAPVIENKGTTNITGGVIGDNAVNNNKTEGGSVNITGGTFTSDELLNDYVNDDYQAIEGENGEITIEKKPTIAKIGDNEYTSLIKAVAAVEDGDTITLENNETFTEENRSDNSGWWDGLSYSGDKSFTIDLNSKTICQEDGALNDYLIWIKNDGSKANTITLKNGTLDAGTTAFCAIATASSNIQKITINLENVNLVGNNSGGAVAKIRGGAELNVKAGTVITGKNNYVGIECVGSATVVNIYEGAKIYQNGTTSYWGSLAGASGNGVINVYGGEGTSAKGGFIAMTSGGTINVNGGEWIANTDGTYANGNDSVLIAQSDKKYNAGAGNSVINVTGGTFKGGYNCYGNAVGDAQINIKGGNFNADPSSYLAEGCEVTEANGVWTVRVLPVAKIGETEYDTLQEAFNVGGDITLLCNVTVAETVTLAEGKTVVLDLNGKTLAHAEMATKYAINNLGTLTITGNGTVNSRGIYNGYGNGEANVASATLTIENGTFNAKGENGGAAVFNYGTANINGGSFTSIGSYSLNNQAGSAMTIAEGVTANNGVFTTGATLTINGGEISGNRSGCHVIYAYNSTVTINGGTLYNNNHGNATVMAAGTTTITYNGGTYGIKDGRVPGNGNTWTSCLLDSSDSATAVINGGTYNGGFRVQAGTSMTINGGSFNDCYGSAYNISGTATVKGGTYTDATAIKFAKDYVAEGYEVNANGEVVAK